MQRVSVPANYDQFAPNFGIAYKTMQRVSVPDLNVFGRMKRKLGAKEVGDFLLCYMGK